MAPTDINHLAGLALLKTKARLMVHVLVVCQAYAEVCHCFFNIFFFFFLRRKEMNKTKSYLLINFLNLRERRFYSKIRQQKWNCQILQLDSNDVLEAAIKCPPLGRHYLQRTAPQWTRAAHRTFNYQTVHIYSDKNISPS